jgi:hypothetical protein
MATVADDDDLQFLGLDAGEQAIQTAPDHRCLVVGRNDH